MAVPPRRPVGVVEAEPATRLLPTATELAPTVFAVLLEPSSFLSAHKLTALPLLLAPACTGVPICAATPTIAKPANTLARTFFLPPLFLATSDTTT